MPRSRLHFATLGVAEYGRWHDPCRSRRNDGSESSRSHSLGLGVGSATSRATRNESASPRAHRPDVEPHEPGTPFVGGSYPRGLGTARYPTRESWRFSAGRMSITPLIPSESETDTRSLVFTRFEGCDLQIFLQNLSTRKSVF